MASCPNTAKGGEGGREGGWYLPAQSVSNSIICKIHAFNLLRTENTNPAKFPRRGFPQKGM